jgi:hypothetical protein
MRARIEGRDVEIVENWRLKEQVRAERAFGIDMMADKTTETEKFLLAIFMSLMREEDAKPEGERRDVSAVADYALNLDVQDIVDAEEDEESPPADAPAGGAQDDQPGKDSQTDEPPTTGLRALGR